jgi:hypothetical protein
MLVSIIKIEIKIKKKMPYSKCTRREGLKRKVSSPEKGIICIPMRTIDCMMIVTMEHNKFSLLV